MPIAVLGHPVGAGEVASPRSAGALGLAARIEVQHDPRNLFPIGALGFGVEQAQIRDAVPLVIAGQSGRSRRRVGDIWVERGILHGRSGNESPDTAVNTLSGRRKLRTTWCLICITRPWFGAQEALQARAG
jgi:hypothetical protein